MFKEDYDPDMDGVIAIPQGGTGATTAAGARTNLGLGTISTQDANAVNITGGTIANLTSPLAIADGGTASITAAAARMALGAQAQDADLDALAALASTGIVVRSASNTFVLRSVAVSSGVTVTNGSGVSGNPTLGIDSAVVGLLSGTQTFTGDKTFSGAFNVDTISERTAANGVSIDGVLLKDSFVEFSEIASPSSPASDKGRLFAKDSGGVTKLFLRDSAGTETVLGVTGGNIFPIFYAAALGKMDTTTVFDGFGVFGTAAFTSTGSSAGTTSSAAVDQYGRYGLLGTGSTINNVVVRSNNSGVFTRLQHLPYLYFTLAINHTTDIRFFAGLSSTVSSATPISADNPAVSMVGVQFSTARGDTALMAVANDAGSPLTATSTGWTVVAGTVIQVFIDVQSTSSIKVYIYDVNGSQLGSTVTLTTDLPASTTNMGFTFGAQCLAASAKSFQVYTASYRNNAFYLTTFPG